MFKNFLNRVDLQKTSLVISICGFSFQLFSLGPWQKKISQQLNSLENKIDKINKL
jgi:hypothetical protein